MNEAREKYMTWMRGWWAGAGRRAIDQEISGHPTLGALYNEAYSAGQKAGKAESEEASKRFGYEPLIVRVCDKKDAPQ